MNPLSHTVSYTFNLPHELLATEPANPRDSSRVFVYDTATDSVQFDHFAHIDKYLPRGSTLVVNRTVVAPSRVVLVKSTGGKVVCLLLLNEKLEDDTHISGMVDRKIEVGETLSLDDGSQTPRKPVMTCVSHQKDSIFLFRLHVSRGELIQLLDKYGSMPIPLYLRHTGLSDKELHKRYQTVYSKQTVAVNSNSGSLDSLFSVAAPTAGLHFTQRVFDKLKKRGITRTEVVLEVGLGTFAPLSSEALEEGKLHTEWYQVPQSSSEAILRSKAQGRKVIAVGTTVVRTLESYAKLSNSEQRTYGKYHPTDIFIREGHKFALVDCLVTNFHLPNSSLIMLVDAFLQNKCAKRNIIDLYEVAIREKFRFYSFGDSMVIL